MQALCVRLLAHLNIGFLMIYLETSRVVCLVWFERVDVCHAHRYFFVIILSFFIFCLHLSLYKVRPPRYVWVCQFGPSTSVPMEPRKRKSDSNADDDDDDDDEVRVSSSTHHLRFCDTFRSPTRIRLTFYLIIISIMNLIHSLVGISLTIRLILKLFYPLRYFIDCQMSIFKAIVIKDALPYTLSQKWDGVRTFNISWWDENL